MEIIVGDALPVSFSNEGQINAYVPVTEFDAITPHSVFTDLDNATFYEIVQRGNLIYS